MNGTIFNIQRFCVNDGDGIRTTVFFKGCPLRCAWCHNPESQSALPELVFYGDKCVSCGRCVAACERGCHELSERGHEISRDRCARCFKCAEIGCGALEGAGRTASVEEVVAEVMKDEVFYANSGGGITLSGGEPLAQPEFALEILKRAKEKGLNTAIETCGYAPEKTVVQIAEYVDTFLFDYKETNPELHARFTGVSNALVLSNLDYLCGKGKRVVLRCPIIPGCNDRADHFDGIAALANKYDSIAKIEIEPYHSLGFGKYASVGKNATEFSTPTEEQKQEYLTAISDKTRKPVSFA